MAAECVTRTIPFDQLTGVLIDVGGVSQLGKNTRELQTIVSGQYGLQYSIAYLYDSRNCPPYLDFWHKSQEARTRAKRIHEATRNLCVEGAICFTFARGASLPCFDMVDYIMNYDICNIYGNVARINVVTIDDDCVLVLGYDTQPL